MNFTGWTSSEEGEDCKVGKWFFFWDARGIIHIDYLLSKQTINGDYYAALLSRLKKKIWKEESVSSIKTMYGHSHVPGFNEFRYELLPHPTYSPDLASYHYFLFPNLKKWFGGKRFTTREQLIVETEAYFEGLDKLYYSDGLKKLENR